MRSRRWKFAASLGLLLCLSASIAVGGFAADASVAEQKGYPGGGGGWPPSDGYAPDGSVLDSDGHYYYPNSWTTVSEATCINKEKQVRYCVWMEWDWWSQKYVQCNHADYREVGEVNPNNHVNTITINKKKATCTEDGYTGDLYCKDCKTTTQTGSSIPAKGHRWGQWKTTKSATCTAQGEETRECKKCGKTEERETKVLGHDWDEGKVTTPATCTKDGVRTYTCKRDASHTKQETIPKTEHTPVAVPAKAATCTETGLTEGSKCQRCGKTLTAQETIPALGHDWNTTSTGVDNCVNVSFRHENETITLCPICGVQNGTQRLNKVTLYTAHAKLVVLRGVLENGMEAMTVAFYEPGISSVTACQRCGAVRDSFSSGASLPQAAENAHFTVDASLVDGYTVMLVQADGTETVLTTGISDGKAIFDVDMKGQGARLLHLVPTTAA